MKTHWEEILLKKLSIGESAPFYLVRANPLSQNPHEELNTWYQTFFSKYLSQNLAATSVDRARKKLELGHQDILSITQEMPLSNYKIEDQDLKEFFTSQAYGPAELPRKIIVLHYAEFITERYANKMLKTLEEPQEQTSIFFLTSKQSPFLQTIESRAIHLKLSHKAKNQNEFSAQVSKGDKEKWFLHFFQSDKTIWVKHQKTIELFLKRPDNPTDFLFAIRKDKALAQLVKSSFIQWQQLSNNSYSKKEEFLKEWRWFQEAETFHNAPLERFYGLLRHTF